MATRVSPDSIAGQARRLYTEELVKGLTHVVQVVIDSAKSLLDKPSEHQAFLRRRTLVNGLMTGAQAWHRGIVMGLRQVLQQGVAVTRMGDLPGPSGRRDTLTLASYPTTPSSSRSSPRAWRWR